MRRTALLLSALAFGLLVLAPSMADARGGRGASMGSRGSQTYSAPPPTRVAPAPARPIERSMNETAPSRPAAAPNSAQPGTAGGMAAQRPFMTGLMGGLLGAGLIGLLFGGGFLGTGAAGFLGMLLQLALLGGLVWLTLRLFRGVTPQPAAAGAGAHARTASPISDLGSGFPGGVPRMGSAGAGAVADGRVPIRLDKADFDAFEQMLKDVQDAWSEADLRRLSALLTPEMLQYFSEKLAEDASRGVRNRVTDVVLEEGDLSEAWREAGRDYATVAMRFSAIDVEERVSDGAVVGGDAGERTVATEYWTFVRVPGGRWLLSAIQQTG